jgi:hypothetical protein
MLTVASDPNQPLQTAAQPLAVDLAPIDSNATTDLVALSASGRLTIGLNAGDDRWQSSRTFDPGLGPLVGMKLSSVNADPFTDLILQGPDSISISLGDGSGQFTLHDTVTPTSFGSLARAGDGPVQMDALLLDGDILTDVVTVAPGADEVLVFLGNAVGSLTSAVHYDSGGDQPVAVIAGDFVGSLAPDLAVGHSDGRVTFLEDAGDGSFLLRSDLTIAGLGTIAGLAASDLDHDGDMDLVVSGIRPS